MVIIQGLCGLNWFWAAVDVCFNNQLICFRYKLFGYSTSCPKHAQSTVQRPQFLVVNVFFQKFHYCLFEDFSIIGYLLFLLNSCIFTQFFYLTTYFIVTQCLVLRVQLVIVRPVLYYKITDLIRKVDHVTHRSAGSRVRYLITLCPVDTPTGETQHFSFATL